MKKLLHRIIENTLNIAFWLCGLALLWLLVQVFFITSFRIPSDSMEPELLAGDAIWVEKWTYGARLFDIFESIQGKQVSIMRMPGLQKVKRNDVLVFNNPCPKKGRRIEMDIMQYYVKRCVALPGDVLRIDRAHYKVSGYNGALGNTENQNRLMNIVEQEHWTENTRGMKAYPKDTLLRWTIVNFGPFYIPAAGDSIPMNRRTINLYKSIIEWEQKNELKYKDEQVYLGAEPITGYRFKKNYYFMAGDKTYNSRDSRYWGLVPEEFIVGRVWRIWKSVNKTNNEIRWKRILVKLQ